MAKNSDQEKTYLITGASRGIGEEIARVLSKKRVRLYLHGRDAVRLTALRKEVEEVGASATILVADLSDPVAVSKMATKIEAPTLDGIIHNAGIAIVKPFEQVTLEEWQRSFAVNVTAPFLISKLLLSRIPQGGSIVHVLSTAARNAFPGWSAYCMTKFALDGFSKSIRLELQSRGIRVMNLYPGAVDTDIWESVAGEWQRDKMLSAKEVARAVGFALETPVDTVLEEIAMGSIQGRL